MRVKIFLLLNAWRTALEPSGLFMLRPLNIQVETQRYTPNSRSGGSNGRSGIFVEKIISISKIYMHDFLLSFMSVNILHIPLNTGNRKCSYDVTPRRFRSFAFCIHFRWSYHLIPCDRTFCHCSQLSRLLGLLLHFFAEMIIYVYVLILFINN